MQTLTIEITNDEDVQMFLHLAKRLNCKIISDSFQEMQLEKTKKALEHLRNIARAGGLTNEIPDPVQWQRDIRKDRPLPGRNE